MSFQKMKKSMMSGYEILMAAKNLLLQQKEKDTQVVWDNGGFWTAESFPEPIFEHEKKLKWGKVE